MKNQSAEQVLNEILLRMNYDSRKTLSENRELIFEQSNISTQQDNLQKSNIVRPEQLNYFAANAVGNTILYIPKGSKVTYFYGRDVDIDYLGEIDSQNPNQILVTGSDGVKYKMDKKQLNDILGTKTLRSFTTPDGKKYWFIPMIDSETSTFSSGYYGNNQEQYQQPKINSELDEVVLKLKKLEKLPSTWETLYEWFLTFREIWQSYTAQVIQTAIALAFGTITGGLGGLLVKFIDWGIDIIILVIDLVAAILDSNNKDKWKKVKESAYVVTLFGALGATIKTTSNFVSWLKINSKYVSEFLDIINKWFTNLFEFLGENFSFIFKPLKQLQEIIERNLKSLVSSATAVYISTFINALPIAGAMVAIIAFNEENIAKAVQPLLDKTIGLTIDELLLISKGPKFWEESGNQPTPEQLRRAEGIIPKQDTSTVVNIANMSKKEVEELQSSTEEIIEEQGNNLLSDLEEESMKIFKEDPNKYMQDVLNLLDGICKEYLTKEYNSNNAKYVLRGDKGIILMINDKVHAVIWSNPPQIINADNQNVCQS